MYVPRPLLARLKDQEGFAIVESLVAMLLIVVGSLAMASLLLGAALVNNDSQERQRAISLARKQLDKLRSLNYNKVGMVSDNIADGDDGRNQVDWKTTYCPIPQANGGCEDTPTNPVATSGRIVSLNNLTYSQVIAGDPDADRPRDPRRAKTVERGPGSGAPDPQNQSSTYYSNGIILYTYVYWNNPVSKNYKIATVVARYKDPPAGSNPSKFAIVKLSTAIVDNPGLGQIPND